MDTYYRPEDLLKYAEFGEEVPELANKYFDRYGAVFAEGELSEREKSLIALAVAHAIQCPCCIDAYSQACLEKGSNVAEMTGPPEPCSLIATADHCYTCTAGPGFT